MTHAPATVAYYAAARHPNKRPLPEAGGAVRPTPKPAGPAAPASTTRYAPIQLGFNAWQSIGGPDRAPAHPTQSTPLPPALAGRLSACRLAAPAGLAQP